MAVAFTELTAISQYDNANSTTFNTPSLTAVANRLYLIFVQVSYSSASPRTLSSVSGGGLGTWTIITGAGVENSGQTRRAGAAYAWSASPGAAAAIAVAWSGATTGCAYAVYEITGFDTTTVIGQSNTATGSATSGAPTLATATSGSGIAASCQTITNEAMNADAGGGWTAGENNTGNTPATSMRSQTRVDISDLSAGFSWTTSGAYTANIVEILVAAGGPTEYQQAASGTLTSSGTNVKQTNALKAGTLTSAGTLAKQTAHSLAGTLSSSATASGIKIALLSLAGTLSGSGALAKQTAHGLAGTLASAGSVVKQTAHALAGMLSSSGVAAAVKIAVVSLTGTLTSAGALSKQASHALEGVLTSAGTIARQMSRALSGILASAGDLATQFTSGAAITYVYEHVIVLAARTRTATLHAERRAWTLQARTREMVQHYGRLFVLAVRTRLWEQE